MQWNFETTKETKPIVRSSLKNIVGNGSSEEPQVNHVTKPPPITTAPMEVERLANVETKLDDTPRVPFPPTRLSNGHTEELESTEVPPPPASKESTEVPPPPASKESTEVSPPPVLQEPSREPTVDKMEVESQSESEDEDDSVITDTIESREVTAKEGGARHMSAMSVSEETRALDEALSRNSVMSMEDSTTELPREEGTEREDPALYEHVGGSSSSEEDVQLMKTAPEATQSLVSLYDCSVSSTCMYNVRVKPKW